MLIVFDLDDTLYPEQDYAKSGFEAVSRHIFESYRIDGFYDLAWHAFANGARRTIFDSVLPQLGMEASDSLIKELVTVYRAHKPKIEMFKDADAFLSMTETIRTGLITDGPRVCQRAKIAALDLESRIDNLICTDELGTKLGKPNPYAFEKQMEHFGAPPNECVYIGDNVTKDFVAPNALGWLTIRLLRDGGIYDDASTAKGGEPQKVIRNFYEIEYLTTQSSARPVTSG